MIELSLERIYMTAEEIVKAILGLQGSELIKVRDALLQSMGLSASDLVNVGSGGGQQEVAEESEKKEQLFRVKVAKTVPGIKVAMIKALKTLFGWSLGESKAIAEQMETAEYELKVGISKEEATKISDAIKAAGAEVKVESC